MPRRKKSSHENQSRSSLSINKDKPQQRYAANARERARMRVLSRAFCRLKTTLPWVPADTKLSKLDTLRLAASYIAHLKGILRDETLGSSESSLHPAMSMTWPFGFNRPLGGSGGSQTGGSILGSEEDEDEDDEDLDDEDGESISSCTWEEVSPPTSSSTKDCIHLETTPSSNTTGGGGKASRARGKMSSTTTTTTLARQVQNKKETTSPSSLSSLNKHNMNLGGGGGGNAGGKCENFPVHNNNDCNTNPSIAIRPLSQTQHHHHFHQQQQQQLHHHHQQQQEQEHLHNEDVMFHHFESELKSNNGPSSSSSSSSMAALNTCAMMTVTNLENAPPHLHSTTTGASPQNEILVGVGNPEMGSNNNSTESFLAEINGSSFTQLSHHHHHVTHGGNEMHHHAPSSSVAYGFGSNDLISIG